MLHQIFIHRTFSIFCVLLVRIAAIQSIATGGVVWPAFVYVGNIHEPC